MRKTARMTMTQHFTELRRRILWTFAVFVLALVAGWYVAPWLQWVLTAPLFDVWPDGELLYTGLTDGLMIRFSLAVLFGLFVTIPFALWQVWAFVRPGLHKKEQRIIWPVLVASPILFLIGAAFAFYVLFPFVFGFFIELNESAPVPSVVLPEATNYLAFAVGMLKIFGVAFQLPLVLVLLNRIGVLSRSWAIKMRRYVIVLIAVIAAVLTPPDVVSQIVLGVPMWLLFEISILFMRKDNINENR
ncbi:MAG: twin-arginine translocase subunit TatC [Proteobacteria bacterium]|uniref:Sec-independent protein translocase protein TatC n=1 Tax=Candidatus Enterousia excrementavium TaxID=2840789 RepID=A0A940IC80_9PROT|nr:twin-arginine translocase subunit TatC [Candidatus Enterousia excrementavium]